MDHHCMIGMVISNSVEFLGIAHINDIEKTLITVKQPLKTGDTIQYISPMQSSPTAITVTLESLNGDPIQDAKPNQRVWLSANIPEHSLVYQMNKISTYIQNPGEITILSDYSFDTLIVDLPFCSVRAHAPMIGTMKSLNYFKKLNATTIALNLDGIYSNHELTIIKSTIESRTLTQFFTAVRIQDPGLILWIKDNYPNLRFN